MKYLLTYLLILTLAQTYAGPVVKPVASRKAKAVRAMDYFTDPQKLMQRWGSHAIPTQQYSAQEVALQKQLNELEDGIVTYSPLGATSERDIDQIPITPYTWKWVTLKHQEADGSYTKAILRRPHAWFVANGITHIGASYHLQVPAAGIDGQVTVTAISPNQLDSRFWDEHRQGDYAARPITGLFEHSRSNVVTLKLTGQDGSIEVTDNHLFYSQTRNDWLPVADLVIGEQIKTRLGTATLEAKTPKAGTYTVYDLELYQDHNFLAGNASLLVHNGCDWVAGKKGGGKLTEPTLPDKTVVRQDGVKIEHYYKSGDHGPGHLHVKGKGASTRIGQNGKPLKNNPELSATQAEVVEANKSEIRKTVKKINAYYNYQKAN